MAVATALAFLPVLRKFAGAGTTLVLLAAAVRLDDRGGAGTDFAEALPLEPDRARSRAALAALGGAGR